MFKRSDARLLYFAAYHSQIDEQSERINQFIEIVLRFLIEILQYSHQWLKTLSRLQSNFNNFISFIIDSHISNEIAYNFTSIQTLNLSKSFAENFTFKKKRLIIRANVSDVIAFAQMKIKFRYDRRHLSLFMRLDDWVLLSLHKEYNISITAQIKKKMSNQYVRSFRIIERIERLAYRLVVLEHWKIHSVFIIAQLKLCSFSETNSFHRSRFTHLDFVYVKDDIFKVKSWELSDIMNKRHSARELEYLIRWKEYEKQYDEWRDLFEMKNIMKLIKKYEKVVTSNDDHINNSNDSLLSSKSADIVDTLKKRFANIVDDLIKSRGRFRKIVIIVSTITAVVLRKLTITTSSTSSFIEQSLSSKKIIEQSSIVMLRKLIIVVLAFTMIEFTASSSSKTFALKILKKVFDNILRRSTRLLKSRDKS